MGEGNGGVSPIGSGAHAKPHFGELVQMDGSFHEWLEERGQRGCLMHMVDDATTAELGRFSAEETIWAAAAVLRRIQPALCTAGGGGSRLSPTTTHGAATGLSVLAGRGTSGE